MQHGTSEKNLESIIERGLLVPGSAKGVTHATGKGDATRKKKKGERQSMHLGLREKELILFARQRILGQRDLLVTKRWLVGWLSQGK